MRKASSIWNSKAFNRGFQVHRSELSDARFVFTLRHLIDRIAMSPTRYVALAFTATVALFVASCGDSGSGPGQTIGTATVTVNLLSFATVHISSWSACESSLG